MMLSYRKIRILEETRVWQFRQGVRAPAHRGKDRMKRGWQGSQRIKE